MKQVHRCTALWLLIAVFLVPSSFAQGFGGTPEERAERAKQDIDGIIEKLALNEESATEVRAILEVQAEEMSSIWSTYAGQRDRDSRSMMRQEMQDMQNMTQEKLAAVLSEEKMEEYKTIVAEMREQRRAQFRRPN